MATADQSLKRARTQLYNAVESATSFEEAASTLLELGEAYLGADNAYISLIDPEISHCEIAVSTFGDTGEFPANTTQNLDESYCRRTVESAEPVALHNASAQGWGDDPAYESHGFEYYLGTQLSHANEPVGTVCFVSEDAREEAISDDEILFVELISQLLARELDREQHQAELDRHTTLVNILNRVLRHNLRNDLSVIRGRAKLMTEQLDDAADGTVVLDKIDELIGLSEKARELEKIVGRDRERSQTDIVALVDHVAGEIEAAFPAATVTVDAAETITAAVAPTFERALRELLENAAKHGGDTPSVTVTISATTNTVEVHIDDDGPGLSEQEREVLTTGVETPLIHGSGLGLWLAHWVVTSHGGTIESTVTETGTTMQVSVPRSATGGENRELVDIQRARDQYRAAFEEAFDAVYIMNDDARIIKANPSAADLYGLDVAELRGRSIMEFLPERYDADEVKHFLQQPNTDSGTVTIITAHGVEREIEISSAANIVPGQHLIIARDVTDRVEREQQLAEAQTAFENTQDAMFLIDVTDEQQFTIQRVNEVYESMTGLKNEAIQGKTPREAVGEEIGRNIETQYQTCVERGETIEYPEEIPVDGEIRHWRTRLTPIIDDGTVVKLVGAMRDVTEQKEQQQALQTERERFEQILETTPVGMAILDQNGAFVRANERAEEILGLSEAEITSRQYDTPDWDLVAADGTSMPSRELPFNQVMETGEPVYDYVHGIEPPDGTRKWLSINAAPLTDDDGVIECVIAAITDITDQHGA